MNRKTIIGLGVAGVIAAGVTGCGSLPEKVDNLESMMNVPAQVVAAKVKDAKTAVDNLEADLTQWYTEAIVADSTFDLPEDVAGLGQYRTRIASLLASPVVKADAVQLARVQKLATWGNDLKGVYDSNVWQAGVVRFFVDAERRSNSKEQNNGGTNPLGGYVFDASLKQVYTGIMAGQLARENATTSEYNKIVADIPGRLANGDLEVIRAHNWATKAVTEMKKEALTELVIAGTSTERRNAISTQLAYRDMRAIVKLYSGNAAMVAEVEGLAPNGTGIRKVDDAGVNAQYLTGGVKVPVANHPKNYK